MFVNFFFVFLPYRKRACARKPTPTPNKVERVAVSNYVDQEYYDWHVKPDIEEYLQRVPEGEFTVQTYCEEALLDRHGSLQLVRWED